MTDNTNKNKLLCSFFRSYMIALLIPIAFCYIVYAKSYSVIREQLLQSNTAIISNTAQLLNEHYLNISDIALQASSNNTLKSSIINASALTTSDKYNIKNALATYKSASSVVSDIYIYYHNADIVISDFGPMSKRLAYDTFHANDSYSFDDWNEQMCRPSTQELVTLRGQNTDGMPAYIQTLPIKETISFATLVIIMDPDVMMSSVKENAYFSNMGLLIYDNNNNLIMSSGKQTPLTSEELLKLSEGNSVANYKDGKEKFIMVYTRPKSSIFKYVTLIPRNIFWHNLMSLRFMLIAASFLVFFTAIWLAYYLSKKNYSPVKKLLTTLQKTSNLEYNPAKNEYHYIAESIEKVMNSSRSYQRQISKQASFINLQFLRRWLVGDITDFDELNTALKIPNFNEDTSCRLILIQTLDYDKLFESDQVSDVRMHQETLLFIIQNVFGELFESNTPLIVPMDSNLFACVVSIANGDIDTQTIFETHTLLKTDLAVTCIAYVSDIYCFADISEAYYRVLYAAVSDKAKEFPCVMVSSIDNGDGSYNFSLEFEQKTMNFIRDGDVQNAQNAIASLFETPRDPDMYTLLKYDIAGMLLKASAPKSGSFTKNIFKRINAAKMPAEIKEVCLSLVKELCEIAAADKEQLSPTTQNIMNYIAENFDNPNLDVTHIGNHFCITPHYISRQFRDQTGIFLKDYINKVRIDASKPLLVHSAKPIADISQAIGYIDSNAFIRVFKKHEGITPGKFRELNKQ